MPATPERSVAVSVAVVVMVGVFVAMAVRMVAADRVKLTLEDEYVARYYLARESPKVRNAVEFLPKSLSENSLHILVSLKNPQHEQIVAGFDREIAAMKADGQKIWEYLMNADRQWRQFIPLNLYDNPILMKNNPEYLSNLLSQSRVNQLRFLQG